MQNITTNLNTEKMKLRGTNARKKNAEYRIVKRKGRVYVLQLEKKPKNNEEGD